jgi:purine-nucleoside phosphorylase
MSASTSTVRDELAVAVSDVQSALGGDLEPRVGLILGSGLGGFADSFDDAHKVRFDHVRGFPPATIEGHEGNLVYGTCEGVRVLALQGRIHYYEGHDLARVAFPARVLVACGCRVLIVTNAAGGVDPTLAPGSIVVMRDHLNLLGGSPLRGPNDAHLGPRFPDMSFAYDPELRRLAIDCGADVGLSLREGVYAASPGPQYETPAEVRMLRTLGADLVGMSTVPEVIAARHMGARVLGLSCVTNHAAGLTDQPLSHAEVTETATRVRGQFQQLLRRVLSRIGASA